MNLEQLQIEVKKDLRIDQFNYDKTAAEIPQIHLKYLDKLFKCQAKLVSTQAKYDALYRKKYIFYKTDYEVVLKNKAEIDILIAGDEEVQKISMVLDFEKMKANYLESVIKQIAGISFLIKDSIEWKKFQAGS